MANARRSGRRSNFTDKVGERDLVEAKNIFLIYDKSPPKASHNIIHTHSSVLRD